jgi:Homoserine dehydrogenase, NAD binding domain
MTKLSVAIAGLGAIGSGMVREIVRSEPNIRISAVSSRDAAKAQNFLAQLGLSVPVLPLQELPSTADLIVECLPAAQFDVIADATMTAGKALMVLSVGQLARRDDIIPFFARRTVDCWCRQAQSLGLMLCAHWLAAMCFQCGSPRENPPKALWELPTSTPMASTQPL